MTRTVKQHLKVAGEKHMSFQQWFNESKRVDLRYELSFLEDSGDQIAVFNMIKRWAYEAYEAGQEDQEWVGLADEEIIGMTCDCIDPENDEVFTLECALEFARRVEESLKERNT